MVTKVSIILSLLFLASCTGSSNHGQSSGSDTAFNKLDVNLPVRRNKAFDYSKLIGSWVYIAIHYNGDTDLVSFLPDTDQSKNEFGYYRVEDFDSAHKWHLRNDDIGEDGSYSLDSEKSLLFTYTGAPKAHPDIVNVERIVYLNNEYLILERTVDAKKYFSFFMNIKARKNWKFAQGG